MSTASFDVAVLGAGMAGMTAALDLARRGLRVVLVEGRRYLGGRCFSFRDRDSGEEIDNGQHVFLHGCTAIRDFLEELGLTSGTFLQDRLEIAVYAAGRRGLLRSGILPGDLHLLGSLLRFPGLTWRDKWRIVRALREIDALTEEERLGLEDIPFAEWLRRRGASEASLRRFWNLLVEPSLTTSIEEANTPISMFLYRETLLIGRDAPRVGWNRTPWTTLLDSTFRRAFAAAGGTLRTEATIREIESDDRNVTGVRLTRGETISATAYVSALPFQRLPGLLGPRRAADPWVDRIRRLRPAAIAGVHLWYDRPVATDIFAAFPDTEVQWVFDEARLRGAPPETWGRHIHVVLSAVGNLVGIPAPRVVARFDEGLRKLLPAAAEAKLMRGRFVIDPHAAFLCNAGVAHLRPPPRTPIANLILAGAWTATGWPSTMEGAVRSGRTAAATLVALTSRAEDGLVRLTPAEATP